MYTKLKTGDVHADSQSDTIKWNKTGGGNNAINSWAVLSNDLQQCLWVARQNYIFYVQFSRTNGPAYSALIIHLSTALVTNQYNWALTVAYTGHKLLTKALKVFGKFICSLFPAKVTHRSIKHMKSILLTTASLLEHYTINADKSRCFFCACTTICWKLVYTYSWALIWVRSSMWTLKYTTLIHSHQLKSKS